MAVPMCGSCMQAFLRPVAGRSDMAVLRVLQCEPPGRLSKEPNNGARHELAMTDQLMADGAQGSDRAAAAPKTTAAGTKVPKWMKAGK